MADTYPLGSIPPFSAWQGETLTFKVTSSLGDGVKFSKRAMPSPKGKVTIDENTGVFTYEPAAEDKEQFVVWIRARKGTKDDKPQKTYITPHAQLPSEFEVIEHVSKNKPDQASSFYTTFSQEDAGEDYFNRKGLDGDAKVMTKKVTVAGVSLVIEENEDAGSLYNRLKGRTDLRHLTLCADEVIIRCELKVPGTGVDIYARQLKFEDTSGKIARIDTTPLPFGAAATKEEGLTGQKAGDVRLFVQSLEMPGNAHRIIANGGQGQEGRQGEPGANGASVKWDGKVPVEGKEINCNGVRGYNSSLVFVDVREEVKEFAKATKYPHRFNWPAEQWPGDGKDPVRLPGRPGRGGDGGSVFTRFKEQLANRVQLKSGEDGKKALPLKGSDPGEPVKPKKGILYYRKKGREIENIYDSLGNVDGPVPKPGKGAEAPPATGPESKPGEVSLLNGKAGESYWLHPSAVRAAIAYSDDAYLAGHTKDARELLGINLDAVKVAAAADTGGAGWVLLRNELAALIQRVDGPYDYFGNPAGWVPMLSFQSNYTLFENELESAIPAMFLAYWIQHTQARTKKAADILKAAKERLHAETERALSDLSAAETKVRELSSGMASIGERIAQTWKLVTDMKKTLTEQVKNDLQTEHLLRSSAKILGGVMQLIPVGQPVLGSVGKALTVLGDVDPDNPKASLSKVAGAFAPVMTEVVLPKGKDLAKKKAEELFSGLMQKEQLALTEKETKAREKKEKFDTAVEKKDFEKKVKDYMEKKEAAKETILNGFSGFAVSEDDVKERLEKVLAETPAYKEAIVEIEKLNEQKREFNEKLVATVQAIDAATTTVLNNQLAILELQGQRDAKLEQLSLEALQSVQDMGRKARERLLLYQYYLLKSYHYLMLEELPEINFGAQKLFDKFSELLTKSEDGMLKEADYKTLRSVFNAQLKYIAEKIITWYSTYDEKSEKHFVVKLTPAQIETLNSNDKRVEVDLLWALNPQHEDIRITNIETDDELVELAEPFPNTNITLSLEYVHDGVSKVRRDGRLYLFRSGQYRVEGALGRPPRTDIRWGTTLEYNPSAKTKKLTVKPTKRDVEAKWLVNELISKADHKENPMTRFRPGAWTRLVVQRSGTEVAKVQSLTLRVYYVSGSVDNIYTTVSVKVADDAQPYIRCDALDENRRGDGTGTFIRTFKKNEGQVTLTAPASYGHRALLGWRQGAAVIEDGPVVTKDQSYTLKLRNTPDYIVEPVYAPVNETPVNEQGEEWPACPVGWVFDDWMFVNGTSSELTISEIRIANNVIPAQVNEPQGGIRVKLSFERLKLLPGEATKLSVCLNKEPLQIQFTEFGFQTGGEQYYVSFHVNGRPSSFKKGGNLVFKSFDVDTDNRVLTFARP
ncbi:MAG TPA: hypothetical protein VGC87_09015 [Pyrinomonadaceae bacterium]|jgi:hypothetical protein